MEKDFVLIKEALTLQKLGFKEDFLGYYSSHANFYKVSEDGIPLGLYILPAPLITQACTFIRKYYDLYYQISYGYG